MKYALITGAGRGLGKGFVDFLISNDYFVFAGVRQLKDEFQNNDNLEYIELDVSNDNSIKESFKKVSSKTAKLDLIVNNAGVNKDSVTNGHKELVCNLNDLKRDLLLHMFNVNSISPLMVTKEFLPLLKSDPSYIINISSYRASFHDEFENSTADYGYKASKIALNMLTFVSIRDLPSNVKTFAVDPGRVKTDMNPQGNQKPLEQAEKILEITKNWKEEWNGKFLRWSGDVYPL